MFFLKPLIFFCEIIAFSYRHMSFNDFILFRIPKDRYCNRHWICHHGIHRIFCQTHPHSHQQHHCRIVDFLLCLFSLIFSRDNNKKSTIQQWYCWWECGGVWQKIRWILRWQIQWQLQYRSFGIQKKNIVLVNFWLILF